MLFFFFSFLFPCGFFFLFPLVFFFCVCVCMVSSTFFFFSPPLFFLTLVPVCVSLLFSNSHAMFYTNAGQLPLCFLVSLLLWLSHLSLAHHWEKGKKPQKVLNRISGTTFSFFFQLRKKGQGKPRRTQCGLLSRVHLSWTDCYYYVCVCVFNGSLLNLIGKGKEGKTENRMRTTDCQMKANASYTRTGITLFFFFRRVAVSPQQYKKSKERSTEPFQLFCSFRRFLSSKV